MIFVLSQAWDEANILSPREEWNLRPLDSSFNALPLSHRDSMVSKTHYQVQFLQHTLQNQDLTLLSISARLSIKVS